MPGKLFFTKNDQQAHLEVARLLTETDEWMPDAFALACYDREPRGDGTDQNFMRCITVLQNRNARGADIHFAATRTGWASRALLRSLALWIYHPRFGGVSMLRATIAEWNMEAQIAALRMGFRFDCVSRAGASDGSDAIVMTMTANECRLLPSYAPQPAPAMRDAAE